MCHGRPCTTGTRVRRWTSSPPTSRQSGRAPAPATRLPAKRCRRQASAHLLQRSARNAHPRSVITYRGYATARTAARGMRHARGCRPALDRARWRPLRDSSTTTATGSKELPTSDGRSSRRGGRSGPPRFVDVGPSSGEGTASTPEARRMCCTARTVRVHAPVRRVRDPRHSSGANATASTRSVGGHARPPSATASGAGAAGPFPRGARRRGRSPSRADRFARGLRHTRIARAYGQGHPPRARRVRERGPPVRGAAAGAVRASAEGRRARVRVTGIATARHGMADRSARASTSAAPCGWWRRAARSTRCTAARGSATCARFIAPRAGRRARRDHDPRPAERPAGHRRTCGRPSAAGCTSSPPTRGRWPSPCGR